MPLITRTATTGKPAHHSILEVRNLLNREASYSTLVHRKQNLTLMFCILWPAAVATVLFLVATYGLRPI